MPGTSVITNSTGRISATMGNSILIPALATAASARKRRRVSSASAYTLQGLRQAGADLLRAIKPRL